MSFTERELSAFAKGDDWQVEFTIKDENNTVIDITGYQYWLTIKSDLSSADPGDGQDYALASGVDAAAGQVTLTIPRATTRNLTAGTYWYDLQQKDTGGLIQTLLRGRVRVVDDVTLTTSP